MRIPIPSTGLVIPKQWLGNADEAQVEQHDGVVTISPVLKSADDPLWQVGQDPIDDEITDASTNHDRYLYGR